MSEKFVGEVYQKVDGKARVSIPAPMRHILQAQDPASAERARPRVYMVYGGAKRTFVECYSMAGHDALAALIERMELGSENREKAEREMISRAVFVEIEPDGRIVLPQKVRAKIGFGDQDLSAGSEVVFVGVTNRFKLYRREVYDAEKAAEEHDEIDPLTRIGRATSGG
jgi:MraZ protein